MPSYKAIFDHLPLPAVVMSFTGKVLDCNESACGSILEGDARQPVPPAWLCNVLDGFLAGGAQRAMTECTSRPSGTRPCRYSLSLARVEHGSDQPHVVAICEDVTRRTRNEEKIRQMAAIIDSSNDAMLSVSLDGGILSANRSAAELYGYGRDELEGTSLLALVPPGAEEEMRGVLRDMRAGRDVIRLETVRRRKDGSVFPVSETCSAIRMDGIIHAISLVSRDITSRRKAELDLKTSNESLAAILGETVTSLSLTLEKRDLYTAGHQQRVARIACVVGGRLDMCEAELSALHTAGVLHDIGKICIPMAILNKPTRLSRDEMGMVRSHPQTALDIVGNIPFALPVGRIIHQHHERMDGSGYPQGLAGGDICIGARILAVADVFEAMSAHRPYRPALGIGPALDEFNGKKGIVYDPDVCDALQAIVEEGLITTHNGEMILCQ